MKVRSLSVALILLVSTCGIQAQTLHERETFRGLSNPKVVSDTLPGAQLIQERVFDGRLRLTLYDAIVLTLANNTDVRIQELGVETATYTLLRSHAPFDPLVVGSFNAQRARSPTSSDLQGAETLSVLTQTTQVGYSQTFETGTNVRVTFDATKLSTNNTFYFLNPSTTTGLSFQFTQPLLRNRWLFANQAPIIIARRNLQATRAVFEAQVNDAILLAVTQYWAVIKALGDMTIARKSQEAAEVTYRRNKRALELGALPPLDIYRSESQVASRRVQSIQAEYALKRTEDQLRFTIGANTDPYLRALDLDLTESPHSPDELRTMDEASALSQAFLKRPELEATRQFLAIDETKIKLANNNLLPDLRIGGGYSSNGLGGNLYDTTTTPPLLVSRGGFGDSLSQLFNFGFPTYGFTVNINLPIKNRSAQSELGDALVSRRRDLYNSRQQQERITLEVANAIRQLEQAKLSVAASQQALELTQKSATAEQRKYDLGDNTVFLVLEAQTELAQAESVLLQAEVGYQIAVATIDHATGQLIESYRVQIADLGK